MPGKAMAPPLPKVRFGMVPAVRPAVGERRAKGRRNSEQAGNSGEDSHGWAAGCHCGLAWFDWTDFRGDIENGPRPQPTLPRREHVQRPTGRQPAGKGPMFRYSLLVMVGLCCTGSAQAASWADALFEELS